MASQQLELPAADGWTRRIGFWLGLALFTIILCLPTTNRMLSAGRAVVRASVETQLHIDSDRRDSPEAHGPNADRVDDYIAARQEWFEQEAARRARALLRAAAVTALIACWWITVAIPIPATSLIPLVMFPLLGVLPLPNVATHYADSNVFLFMGGFIIALGIEKSGLHRRIALHVISLVGTGQPTIILGFMLATAALSMWISNTATTLMMLPIALAVIASLPGLSDGQSARPSSGFSPALMLAVAYSASVGGIATPIGTPPNIAFKGQLQQLFPDAPDVGFGAWMVAFLPLVAVMLLVIWLLLTRVLFKMERSASRAGRDVIRRQLRDLGSMIAAERWMLAVFLVTALLWVFRLPIVVGEVHIPGWTDLLVWCLPNVFHPDYINDATVAMAMAVLLFIIPCGRGEKGGRRCLMDWQTATRLPWGILLLFGGGFAVAAGFRETGLSVYLSESFTAFAGAPFFVLVIGTCLLMTFLTELTSNTATTQIMLPVMAGAATQAFGMNPLLLMLAATLSASCAFMMPVATPPNAIVFASGHVKMSQMVRTGLILNFVCAVLVSLGVYFVSLRILGASAAVPPWAQ